MGTEFAKSIAFGYSGGCPPQRAPLRASRHPAGVATDPWGTAVSGQPPASSHYRAWLYEQPQERREELLALEGAYVRERARARRQDRLEAAFEESLQGRQDTPAGGLIIVKRVPWL